MNPIEPIAEYASEQPPARMVAGALAHLARIFHESRSAESP